MLMHSMHFFPEVVLHQPMVPFSFSFLWTEFGTTELGVAWLVGSCTAVIGIYGRRYLRPSDTCLDLMTVQYLRLSQWVTDIRGRESPLFRLEALFVISLSACSHLPICKIITPPCLADCLTGLAKA